MCDHFDAKIFAALVMNRELGTEKSVYQIPEINPRNGSNTNWTRFFYIFLQPNNIWFGEIKMKQILGQFMFNSYLKETTWSFRKPKFRLPHTSLCFPQPIYKPKSWRWERGTIHYFWSGQQIWAFSSAQLSRQSSFFFWCVLWCVMVPLNF